MLTKKECLEALLLLWDEVAQKFEVEDGELICYDRTQADEYLNLYIMLEQLIKEHFDNKPLKFEELKEGMWVWDNKEKQYIMLDTMYKRYDGFVWQYCRVGWEFKSDLEYEENRYYRREV